MDDGWKFDAKANPLDARQRRAIGLPEKNPPGTPYQRTESSGQVVVRAGRGQARCRSHDQEPRPPATAGITRDAREDREDRRPRSHQSFRSG